MVFLGHLKVEPIGSTETSVLNQSTPRNFFFDTWPLKRGPIGSPETSVLNHSTLCNNPEDGRIQFNGSGSLRSRIGPICCPKTSVARYEPTPRSIQEEERPRSLSSVTGVNFNLFLDLYSQFKCSDTRPCVRVLAY